MKTRLLSESRSAVLEAQGVYSERWFTRTYSVPVFSALAAERWKAVRVEIWKNHFSGEPYRLVKVRTIQEMER